MKEGAIEKMWSFWVREGMEIGEVRDKTGHGREVKVQKYCLRGVKVERGDVKEKVKDSWK